MKTRVISGVCGALVLVAALVLNAFAPISFSIAIAIVCALAVYEVAACTGLSKQPTLVAASLLVAVFVPLAPLMPYTGYPVVQTVFFIYSLFLFSHMIFCQQSIRFADLAVLYAGSVAVPYALSALIRVRDLGGEHGAFFILFTLIAAWTSDMGAYFAGVRFGKHPLAPAISPKKTVEGFVGGIVGCVLCMLLAVFVYTTWLAPAPIAGSYPLVAAVAAVASVISVAGDLTFSMLKRNYQIKDFGNIMPGHGGVLDRFDSVVFVAPFVCLAVQFFPIFQF